jgi:hypothetical protein
VNQEREHPSSEKGQHTQHASTGDQSIGNQRVIPKGSESDDSNSTRPSLDLEAVDGEMERRRFLVERAAVIVAFAALLASVITGSFQIVLLFRQDAIGGKQAEIAAEQAQLSNQQNGPSSENIKSTRFQSIYERMLDVDRFLVNKPPVAQVVFQADANTAAEIYVLDFDNYVWDNVRTIIKPDAALYPSRFSLRNPLPGGEPVEKTDGWTDSEWEAWQTWSETIVGHFRSPSGNSESDPGQLCSVLNNSRAAYPTEFVDAVVASHVCPVRVLPPS